MFGGKDNANREQKKELAQFFVPRCSLSYGKIMQIESRKKSLLNFLCRDARFFHLIQINLWEIKSFANLPRSG